MLRRDSVEINFVSSLPLPEQTRLVTDMRSWAVFLGILPLIIKITASVFCQVTLHWSTFLAEAQDYFSSEITALGYSLLVSNTPLISILFSYLFFI